MIIIEVCFEGSRKSYKYLLVNPSKFKINPAKNLIYSYGVTGTGVLMKKLIALKCYHTDALPPIVTSQIVLLDENNNIDIQKIGTAELIEDEGKEEVVKPDLKIEPTVIKKEKKVSKASRVYVDVSKHIEKLYEEYRKKKTLKKIYKKYS